MHSEHKCSCFQKRKPVNIKFGNVEIYNIIHVLMKLGFLKFSVYSY
jgi:hypothetical protein